MANPEIKTYTAQEEPRPAQTKSFQNTLDFLTEATVIPAERKTPTPPLRGNQSLQNWQRNWTITGLYSGTDKTLEEIGDDYNKISTERVRQIVKAAVLRLWEIQTPQVRETFPWKSFDFKKPLSLEKRLKRLQENGSKRLEVAQLLFMGKSISEIGQELDLNSYQLTNTRRILKAWGIDVPYYTSIHKRFEKLTDPDLPDGEVQQILDIIPRNNYQTLSRGKKPILISVTKVARSAGLFFSCREVKLLCTVLRNTNVLLGSFPHYSY